MRQRSTALLCTCTTRPVFVWRCRKRSCRLESSFLSWLCVCRGGREERRRLFSYSAMKSGLCLPVSMTTTLLQYSAVGRPLHLKAFPSGVSVALCVFFLLLLLLIYRVCVWVLEAALFWSHIFTSEAGLKFPRLPVQTCRLLDVFKWGLSRKSSRKNTHQGSSSSAHLIHEYVHAHVSDGDCIERTMRCYLGD